MKKKKIKSGDFELNPLIEVIKYSDIKKNDVIIIRCEEGEENEALSSLNSRLFTLIQEKDLRLLAVPPNFNHDNLFIAIETTKNFKIEKQDDNSNTE